MVSPGFLRMPPRMIRPQLYMHRIIECPSCPLLWPSSWSLPSLEFHWSIVRLPFIVPVTLFEWAPSGTNPALVSCCSSSSGQQSFASLSPWWGPWGLFARVVAPLLCIPWGSLSGRTNRVLHLYCVQSSGRSRVILRFTLTSLLCRKFWKVQSYLTFYPYTEDLRYELLLAGLVVMQGRMLAQWTFW
jgi:hypothetical protein